MASVRVRLVTDTVTIHRNYPTQHFTVTLQAISGLSPTTGVISTLPYYETLVHQIEHR